MRMRWIFLVPLMIVGFAIFLAIGGVVVMLLWNWLLPTLFDWPQIAFWQALGLLALCRILFGGAGIGHSVRTRSRRRMAERWQGMTADERERLRQRFGDRWCPAEPPSSDPMA